MKKSKSIDFLFFWIRQLLAIQTVVPLLTYQENQRPIKPKHLERGKNKFFVSLKDFGLLYNSVTKHIDSLTLSHVSSSAARSHSRAFQFISSAQNIHNVLMGFCTIHYSFSLFVCLFMYFHISNFSNFAIS